MRDGLKKRILPICLDAKPVHPLRFPFSSDQPLSLFACELVERYEAIVEETMPRRSRLVVRNVLDSNHWKASHLPLCPPSSDFALLPERQFDCVACTLDYDVNFLRYACYVLRLRGKPGLLTAELYLTSTNKPIGIIPGQVATLFHAFKAFDGQSAKGSHEDRKRPSLKAHEEAKEKGEEILHFLENALDLASQPLHRLSAQGRFQAPQRSAQQPSTSQSNRNPPPPQAAPKIQAPKTVPKVVPPPIKQAKPAKTVYRRGDDNRK